MMESVGKGCDAFLLFKDTERRHLAKEGVSLCILKAWNCMDSNLLPSVQSSNLHLG